MNDIIQTIFGLFSICFLFFIIGYCCGSNKESKKEKTICTNCAHCEVVYINDKGETKIKTDCECCYGACFDPYTTLSCKKFIDKNRYNNFKE